MLLLLEVVNIIIWLMSSGGQVCINPLLPLLQLLLLLRAVAAAHTVITNTGTQVRQRRGHNICVPVTGLLLLVLLLLLLLGCDYCCRT